MPHEHLASGEFDTVDATLLSSSDPNDLTSRGKADRIGLGVPNVVCVCRVVLYYVVCVCVGRVTERIESIHTHVDSVGCMHA